MRSLHLTCLSVWCLGACEPKIPKGVLACDLDDECPQELVCRAAPGEAQKFCNSAEVEADPDAAVHIGPGVKPLSVGTFSTLGSNADGVRSRVFDDGFHPVQQSCSATGAICVTGGFQP